MEVTRSALWLGTMLLLVLAEAGWRLASRRGYDGAAAFTTLWLVLGNIPFAALNAGVVGSVFMAAARRTPLDWPVNHWGTWAAGFIAVEFAYYWFHRASHRVRWMWATHSVHHSAEQFTLLASLRLGWTNLFSAGWLVYLPLVLLGLPPFVLVALLTLNLRYQFFLHTEAVGRLGPFEWLFNTPTHHRLHHASNHAYIDKNYGGVLILFDRLFGTLAREQSSKAIRYGLAHRPSTANPVWLVCREWAIMLAEARHARGLRAKITALVAMP
ncbi:sterol desaturase [Sphingobium sp. TA15]|uniref:Sterol desaturase n=1 Tax=Sphingobium indicum (strain DSM 16413 / CCM 7287 / MTCC 6362 / UT26 / NBRC 101211 / UT26S) TaxID=452662 RepID=D4Z448_SPHIU|nr:sterol desaturase family protein [Sphingobium indicum]BAI97380.1 sterol desaturase [Sphingobium indicum UT26S]BDD66797.1 sterol desaturase [Sphingobium sp. TA15]